MKMTRITIVLLTVLVVPSAAWAEYLTGDRARSREPAAETWGYQNLPMEHDRGFLLRLSVAPAYLITRTRSVGFDDPAPHVRVEGGGFEVGAAVGGIVAYNLALHGTLTAVSLPAPRVFTDGSSSRGGTFGATLVGIAPGLTYYLPHNFFVTTSFGANVLLLAFDDEAVTDPGVGYGLYYEFALGKEWWVGPYAGLGIFGRVTTHRAVTDLHDPFGGVTVAIGLTLTFN